MACGVVALIKALQEHDRGPIWPWATRQASRAASILPRRRGQDLRRVVESSLGVTDIVVEVLTVTAETIPPRENVAAWVVLLEQRLERLAATSQEQRAEAASRLSALRTEVDEQWVALKAADEQLRDLTTSVATSTARLQLVGLVLVGLGTVLMALPAIGGW